MRREAADNSTSWDTGYHDVSPIIRTWNTNRDIIPPSGRTSTLKGPGRNELYGLPTLPGNAISRFCLEQAHLTWSKLQIYVSDAVVSEPHLLQFPVQFLV